MVTTSRVRSWVAVSTTGIGVAFAVDPEEFTAVTHQRSPAIRPGNRYWGSGVGGGMWHGGW